MPSFKGMIHVRVKKKRIYHDLGKGNGVYVWESVTQQVDPNRRRITALLRLLSPHHPAVATGFVSWAQSPGNFAQEEFVVFLFPNTSDRRMSVPFLEIGFQMIAKEGLFFFLFYTE